MSKSTESTVLDTSNINASNIDATITKYASSIGATDKLTVAVADSRRRKLLMAKFELASSPEDDALLHRVGIKSARARLAIKAELMEETAQQSERARARSAQLREQATSAQKQATDAAMAAALAKQAAELETAKQAAVAAAVKAALAAAAPVSAVVTTAAPVSAPVSKGTARKARKLRAKAIIETTAPTAPATGDEGSNSSAAKLPNGFVSGSLRL
jgi:hypothetical protein